MTKSRALLLDRDGVINVDTGYVGTIDAYTFIPSVFPFLRSVRDLGYRLAIITNQAGVAHRYYSEQDFNNLTAHMIDRLGKEGINIDLILACFEHGKGVDPAFTRQSFWRKPKPGMVLEAIRRMNLDPARSAFIGDRESDMLAAEAGGIRRRLWLTPDNVSAPGVHVVRNFDDALRFLVTDAS